MIGVALNPTERRGAVVAAAKPTFISADPRRPAKAFKTVGALAAAVQRWRGRRGLQLRTATASFQGSPVFEALELYWLVEDDAEFAGVLAIQGVPREAMERAIADQALE